MKISEIQVETAVLEGSASIITDAEFTGGASNNGVFLNDGSAKITMAAVPPVGTTKIRIYLKKSSLVAPNPVIGLFYDGGSAQYGVISNETITTNGIHYFETSTLPNPDNGLINVIGDDVYVDRLEFHNNSVASGSDIQQISGSLAGKLTWVSKFTNAGPDAIAIGSTILFVPTFSPAYGGTITPVCSKGTFAASGASWVLTLTSAIANSENFDINFAFSTALKKSTTFTFDVSSVTGFTETNLANDTSTATFTPVADLSIVEVSKASTGFVAKVTNIGTDIIASGQIITLKAFGSNVPTGASLTASTPKGTIAGTDWTNGVLLTLSSDLAVAEEFTITFVFSAAVTASYTSETSVVWQSGVTDSVSGNNTVNIAYTHIVPIPLPPVISNVISHIGEAQTGTSPEAGTIQMILNGNIVGTTTTSGIDNAWSIVISNVGTYTFKLSNANGVSLASIDVVVSLSAASSSAPISQQDTAAKKADTSKNGNYLAVGIIVLAVSLILWLTLKKP